MKKIIILMALISMFLVWVANAAPTPSFVTTTWGDDAMINISLTEGINVSTVVVTFSASDTANSTSIVIINISNTTATNFNFAYANFTFGDDIVLEDTIVGSAIAKAELNGTACGATCSVSSSATTILVDRTKPQAPTTTQASESILSSGDTVTYTVTGANTTRCRIAFMTSDKLTNIGSITYAMTHSGNTCTYTLTDSLGDGAYNLYAWATDETNSSYSSKLLVEVDTTEDDTIGIGDGYQIDVAKAVAGKKISDEMIIVVIIIITAIVLLYKKK